MHVLASQLRPDVSITLIQDTGGWRFGAWMDSSTLTERPLPSPPAETCQRRFATPEAALLFFRAICPKS